jgi:glycosyltransferase involved in cell wall biosynthesis
MHCGIDLAPYEQCVDRAVVRRQFGIATDAFVIGHVGRFMAMKNHDFLVNVFALVHAQRPEARLLLVGDGPLRGEIEHKVRNLGLTDAVVFAGAQANVSEILMGAMDCFVFPSSYEGLGLAVVEAQAAGLPCFVSNSVPPDATIAGDLICRLSNEQGPDTWAEQIVKQSGAVNELGRRKAYERIRSSTFNIVVGVDALRDVYEI